MSHLAQKFFYRLLKIGPIARLKFPRPPFADDVSRLLRTVKMPQCVVFGCSNQEKTRKDTSISFNKPLLQPKATHCGILTVQSNHDTLSTRSALRAIQDGGRGNFKRVIGGFLLTSLFTFLLICIALYLQKENVRYKLPPGS